MTQIDVLAYNRLAWDRLVNHKSEWTIPVDKSIITAAKRGIWKIFLTPSKPIPKYWFPDNLHKCEALCLASGGGQQGPILAAIGTKVTVLDISSKQLEQDKIVAKRESLKIKTVIGTMTDLSMFSNSIFDLIIHPVSNHYIPDILPVWKESFRVLRHGGILLSGFSNPFTYLFDYELAKSGIFQVKHKLPYSDINSISYSERQKYIEQGIPLEFSHTLTEQIGGQLDAGFLLTNFFEDSYNNQMKEPLSSYMPTFIATRSIKQ